MTETLTQWGTHLRVTQQEQSNEYQHDRVSMTFISLYILVFLMKEVSALEGLKRAALHRNNIEVFSMAFLREIGRNGVLYRV